jgi:glutamyl-tRNA synthetase
VTERSELLPKNVYPSQDAGLTEDEKVRVRFCPSPTGNPHVGMIRTALFNWAFARHTGGDLIFRIEDTDAARDSEESYEALLDAMRWLGLDWDEGPEVGGGVGPYRQSERMDIYADVAARLEDAGLAYRCYCTSEEVDARYELAKAAAKALAVAAKEAAVAAGADNRAAKAAFQDVWATEVPQPGYDGHCRSVTSEQVADFAGRSTILRFRIPDREIRWHDLIRGELKFAAKHVPDFGLVRANGRPLYTLVNPVDDALMGITHVLRGEDLLSSTPRQIALFAALREIGLIETPTPHYGHLPYVMGEGNKKLSKRDPESSLNMYRELGFLPEGLLNYLALLGWSMPRAEQADSGIEAEMFSMSQMVTAFEVSAVNANPARFDLKKCTAINAAWIRKLSSAELLDRLVPYLSEAGFIAATPTPEQHAILVAAVPLVQERMETLVQAVPMLGFLFTPDHELVIDEADAGKLLQDEGTEVVAAARSALGDLDSWDTEGIQQTLRAALVDGLGLKPRLAFGPIRVAITGRRISPPLFESMEILGRDASLARLDRVLAKISG